MKFNDIYAEYKSYFEDELLKSIEAFNGGEENLISAMRYSLQAGGKRIRPVIMLMVADVLGLDKAKVLPFCLAIEYVHTYSLIHDDLPSMDDDDLRRGKPTNHVVYGEAIAILAGDGLLNRAFEIAIEGLSLSGGADACKILFNCSGIFGMVGGQAYDIKNDKYPQTIETLLKIHENKTGKLITASTVIPSCLAFGKHYDNLKAFGEKLGLLFQITDDLLDLSSTKEIMGKNVNKDEDKNKLTFVTLLGESKATAFAKAVFKEALESIEAIENNQILIELANYVYNRKN